MTASLILNRLSPFENKKVQLSGNQNTNDIITAIKKAHSEYANEYDKISSLFKGATTFSTCKNVYNFLKTNCRYVVESDKHQTVRSPAAIVSMGKTFGNDCKNYSLFAAGVLNSLQRQGLLKEDYFYRFASYDGSIEPSHVFVVCKDNGKEIWIDPVLDGFNRKDKKYTHKIDKKFMALYKISGIGGNIVAQVLVAPARVAFVLLVKLNVFGLGTKMKAAYDKDKNKTNTWWNKLGGSNTVLQKAAKEGSAKKRIFGIGEPATVTAAATITAAPIIIKLLDFLKSIGFSESDLKDLGEAAKKGIKTIVVNAVDKSKAQELPMPDDSVQEEKDKKGISLGLLIGLGVGALLLFKNK